MGGCSPPSIVNDPLTAVLFHRRRHHPYRHLYHHNRTKPTKLIHRVTFDLGRTFSPPGTVCNTPVLVVRGGVCWRFQAPPQTSGSDRIEATVILVGAGGTRVDFPYVVQCARIESGTVWLTPPRTFVEARPIPRHTMRRIPPDQRFGVELELTSTEKYDTATVAETVNGLLVKAGMRVVVVDSHWEAKKGGAVPPHVWRLVPDGSIACHRTEPNCNRFELVSPILKGGRGLHHLDLVLRAFVDLPLKVNKSMGFHVHVDVAGLSVPQLARVCQNFCRYEDAMDALVPPSRRTGAPESDAYFRSNRRSMGQKWRHLQTHRARHDALGRAGTHPHVATLADLMNPDGDRRRHYKLNLQNLVTGRQTTVEFRQHSATFNFAKVSAWVRFCVNFVRNSAQAATEPPRQPLRDRPPGHIHGGGDDRDHGDGDDARRMGRLTREFDGLFQNLIKDRALTLYYQRRMRELELKRILADTADRHDGQLLHGREDGPCCNGCGGGGACQRK